MKRQSLWREVSIPKQSRLKSSQHFDVVVVGAGITGLTAAYLLKQAGKRVCVLERDQPGSVDTGNTTAHLTYVTDSRLSDLISYFGRDQARLAWQGGAAAINTIERIVHRLEIDCQFRRVPGFLHTAISGKGDERKQLRKEADLARQLGFEATFVEAAPIVEKPGIRFANQAKFHPLAYLKGLARAIHGDGSKIFDHAEVSEVKDPLTVVIGRQQITCDYLVIATHVPLMGKSGMLGAGLFQSKLIAYSTYAVAAEIPAGKLPEVSLWDTSEPYYYLRIDRGRKIDYAIFGGADHKTGQKKATTACFADLESHLGTLIPGAKPRYRWSGQVIETNDGLPYIGETAERQFVATGFAGNGMTFGTLAAMMACDAALGRENPWQQLFDVDRKKIRGGTWKYLKENLDYPYYLLRDRLAPADVDSVDEVQAGDGKILKVDGQRVACSRDRQGKLHAVSAICTHLGCVVHWNRADQTWDCPCHGSRFQVDGEVMAGPAESPLEPVQLKAAKSRKVKQPAARKPSESRKTSPRQPSSRSKQARTTAARSAR